MMIAMPSDGLWGDGSGYVPHAHADYEKWIVDDIPRCLRELYSANPSAKKFLLAGLSMGRLWSFAIRHEIFVAGAGNFCAFSITKVEQLSQFIPYPAQAFQYAGDVDTDLLHWAKVNHDTLPPIRFDCGTEDPLI